MALDLLRKSQNWFTRGVLVLLAITFVFGFGFSISNFGSGSSVPQGSAAQVNGDKITLLEFYRARDNLYRQYQQQGEIPEWATNIVARGALDQLIDLKLLAQKAKELGFRVTDEELNKAIVSDPGFQVDGQFIGEEAYQALVEQALNQSPGEFERYYREELLVRKLLNFLNDTAKTTDEELLNLYKMQNEKANLYYLRLSADEFMDSSSPTDEDIKKYYQNHKSEFKSPEKRSIRYITFTAEYFRKKVSVSPEEVKAYYDAYPEEFRTEEDKTRPFSEVRDDIKDKLERQKIGLVRSQYLDNLASSIENGPLEKIAETEGAGKVLESDSFSASDNPPGIPSQIVERTFSIEQGDKTFSQVGDDVWIIELAGIIPPEGKELKDVKEEIRESIKSMKAREAAQAKAKEILDNAKKNGVGLQKLSKSSGLKLEETGFFTRMENVPQINSSDLRIDAFLLDEQNPLASKVYASEDEFYVVQLKEKLKPDPKEFERKKAALKESMISERRREIYTDWIQKLRQESKIIVNEELFLPQG